MKSRKRKKSSRMHGHGMGTHGWGARKKHKKSGHRGGKGMSGTGKRSDQKKTLITKLYGNRYFGKQGITSKGTKKDKTNKINLGDIQKNLEKYGKKTQKGIEVILKSYKILGTGEIKDKLIITAKSASKSAIKKVEKIGGKLLLVSGLKNKEKKGKTNKKIILNAEKGDKNKPETTK